MTLYYCNLHFSASAVGTIQCATLSTPRRQKAGASLHDPSSNFVEVAQVGRTISRPGAPRSRRPHRLGVEQHPCPYVTPQLEGVTSEYRSPPPSSPDSSCEPLRYVRAIICSGGGSGDAPASAAADDGSSGGDCSARGVGSPRSGAVACWGAGLRGGRCRGPVSKSGWVAVCLPRARRVDMATGQGLGHGAASSQCLSGGAAASWWPARGAKGVDKYQGKACILQLKKRVRKSSSNSAWSGREGEVIRLEPDSPCNASSMRCLLPRNLHCTALHVLFHLSCIEHSK